MLKFLMTSACVIGALAAAGNAVSGSVFFADGNFGSGWVYSLAGIRSGDTETHSATTPPTGGDPGAFESEQHTLTSIVGGDDAAVYYSNFNPVNSFTGRFATVSYSWDLNDLGAPAVGYYMAIEQGGVVYAYANGNAGGVFPPTGWANGQNPFSGTNLNSGNFCEVTNPLGTVYADHFLDCSHNPVFNSATQVSVFGFAVANSFTSNGNTGSYASGIDNWCVQLKKAVGTAGAGQSKRCHTKR
jgi:hypothetical protein